MSAPLPRLSKAEIDWLYNHSCKAHNHRYSEHYNCYLKEQSLREKIGFLDIETSGLNANYGICVCWCIKPLGEKEIIKDIVSSADLRDAARLDKRVVESCIKTMRQFDRIVGHYSSRFDIPFLRTRALVHKVDFPFYKEICHTDVWLMARRLLKLNSNRQGTIAQAIQGTNIKTSITPRHWMALWQTNEAGHKSRQYILDHCERDVKQLEKNYITLVRFTRQTNTSI